MTAQGSAYTRFKRALRTGNAWLAQDARELKTVDPAHALELVLLYRGSPERYGRAAARWINRYVRSAQVSLKAEGVAARRVGV